MASTVYEREICLAGFFAKVLVRIPKEVSLLRG